MVYNEWGAIIQHQDEMDKAMRAQENQRQMNLKLRYKEDLDNQRADVARKLKEGKYEDALLAQNMLEYQNTAAQRKADGEDARRLRLKDQIIAKQKESLAEK